ncbi:SDR family NAD(P)-dependent oxidoreductase [Geminicoccus roseus]|uniref:SDR family NAD(P)-dependent oxidoreductase n=1 Tax=Geminicoccus roseus TaxID=404900 RepID=UPI0004217097|nr:SDR family oxidoreductase [Geminicoccus roseus]
MNFQDKVVVVTGGASGIGGAATRAFAQAGAKVAFTYATSEAEARALEKEFAGGGMTVRGSQVDATSEEAVDAFFAKTEQEFGPVDVLFANSGGLVKRARCVEATLDLWRHVMDLNVTSTFLACRAALRSMEPRGKGAIVTMSSLAAFDGGGNGASIYGASKAAVATLTRALAKEVGPLGIRVNGVAPGLIGTRFHDVFNTPQGRAAAVERIPLRREGVPDDVAQAVLYLASEQASYLAGEILQVNGGAGF